MLRDDFNSNHIWFARALTNIIKTHGYPLSDQDNIHLVGALVAMYKLKPSFGSMIYSLDYIDRTLEYANKLKSMHGDLIKIKINLPNVALACMLIGSKVDEDLAVLNKDFATKLPKHHPLHMNLRALAQLEKEILGTLDYRIFFSTDETIKTINPKTQLTEEVSNPLFEETRLTKIYRYIDPADRKIIEAELAKNRNPNNGGGFTNDASLALHQRAIHLAFSSELTQRLANKKNALKKSLPKKDKRSIERFSPLRKKSKEAEDCSYFFPKKKHPKENIRAKTTDDLPRPK